MGAPGDVPTSTTIQHERGSWQALGGWGTEAAESSYLESAIPAKALYHAKNAANMPKTPPAFFR